MSMIWFRDKVGMKREQQETLENIWEARSNNTSQWLVLETGLSYAFPEPSVISFLSPANNTIDHFLFLWPFSGPSLLVTPFLLHMLIVPRMPLAQIFVACKMQSLASHFRRQGITRSSQDFGGGSLVLSALFIVNMSVWGRSLNVIQTRGLGWGEILCLYPLDCQPLLPNHLRLDCSDRRLDRWFDQGGEQRGSDFAFQRHWESWCQRRPYRRVIRRHAGLLGRTCLNLSETVRLFDFRSMLGITLKRNWRIRTLAVLVGSGCRVIDGFLFKTHESQRIVIYCVGNCGRLCRHRTECCVVINPTTWAIKRASEIFNIIE